MRDRDWQPAKKTGHQDENGDAGCPDHIVRFFNIFSLVSLVGSVSCTAFTKTEIPSNIKAKLSNIFFCDPFACYHLVFCFCTAVEEVDK